MYRQKAADIKQKACRAQNYRRSGHFEEVARAWLLLAEQIAWMDSQKRASKYRNAQEGRYDHNMVALAGHDRVLCGEGPAARLIDRAR
jgi:hypothetical protein